MIMAAEKTLKVHREFAENYQEPLPHFEYYTESMHRYITHEKNGNGFEEKEFVFSTSRPAELHSWLDKRQLNPDIPDSIHSYEQGHTQRRNEMLDHQGVNDRDFRQRCVIQNGRLYVLYEKRQVDFNLPQHRDPKWIASMLDCHIDIAIKIVKGLAALNLNRKDSLRLIFNKEFEMIDHNPATLADYLEELATATEEPDWSINENPVVYKFDDSDINALYKTPISSNRKMSAMAIQSSSKEDDQLDGWIYMTDNVLEQLRTETYVIDPDTNMLMVNDQLENEDQIKDDTFGAFPLHWGAEALSHEFLTMIRLASTEKLQEIQKGFFPSTNVYTGRTYPPKYGYLTDSQKAQAWVYMKDRKRQLVILGRRYLSNDSREVLSWMQTIDNPKISAALLYAYKDQRPFNWSGVTIRFDTKPSESDMAVLWDEYEKLQ